MKPKIKREDPSKESATKKLTFTEIVSKSNIPNEAIRNIKVISEDADKVQALLEKNRMILPVKTSK